MNPKLERDFAILETSRLRLRRTRDTDIPALVALWTDPEVTRYMGGPRQVGVLEEALRESFEKAPVQVYDLWPVEEKSTGEVIGDCGLLPKEIEGVEEIELVYVISHSRWGRGYATEAARGLKRYAFETLDLRRIVSLIDPENIASQRVAEKLGLELEREVARPGENLRRVFAIDRPSRWTKRPEERENGLGPAPPGDRTLFGDR